MRLVLMVLCAVLLVACNDNNNDSTSLSPSSEQNTSAQETAMLDELKPPQTKAPNAPDLTGVLPKGLYPPR